MIINNKAYLCLAQVPSPSSIAGAYRDYIGGYVQGCLTLGSNTLRATILSDNGTYRYWEGYMISYESSASGLGTYYIDTEYCGYALRIARLKENGLTTSLDLYGKGILYLNEVEERTKIQKVLKKFNIVEMILTRYDDAIDIIDGRLYRPLKIKSKKKQKIYGSNKKLEYISYGSRRSATFTRVYNKSQELADKGTAWLYPDYQGLTITRYEIQTTSKGIDPTQKIIQIADLEHFAKCVATPINHNRKSHKNTQKIKTEICIMAKKLLGEPVSIQLYAKKKFNFLQKI